MKAIQNLTLREKVILVFAIIALTSLSFHALVWEPLSQKTIDLTEQLEQEHENLNWIKQNIGRLKAQAIKPKIIKGSLVSWLDLQVKKHQLKDSLKRIKPKGENEVKIWLEQTNVKQLMQLLGDISQYAIEIDAIKLVALDEPGVVNANIVLVKQ